MSHRSREDLRRTLSGMLPLHKVDRAILISLKNRFVFARIPKVANSSIKNLIYRMESFHPQQKIRENLTHDIHYGPVIRPSMLGFNSRLLNRALFSKAFFRFTFVRNPYARALSNYLDRYMDKHSTVRHQINASATRLGLIPNGEEILPFPIYLTALSKMEPTGMDIHLTPQVREAMTDLIPYDFVGSFENLAEDLAWVAQRIWQVGEIDLGFQSPSRTNAADRLRDSYTSREIALVNSIYAADFETFGYRMVEDMAAFNDPTIVIRQPA